MGTTSTLAALSAGVVLGVFISQQYAVPDLKEGVDWLVSECSTRQLHGQDPGPLTRLSPSPEPRRASK